MIAPDDPAQAPLRSNRPTGVNKTRSDRVVSISQTATPLEGILYPSRYYRNL